MTIAHPAPPNTREHRALALYRERRDEIRRIAPDVYLVPSCTGSGVYLVEYGGERESCSCPDAQFHPDRACKHLLAVAICRAKHRRPRTYSEHVEAARRDAAAEYREEIRALMRVGKL
jgi:hypothetical protein